MLIYLNIFSGVAPTILQLLHSAIVVSTNTSSNKKDSTGKINSNNVSRKEREKSDDSAAEALFEEGHCVALVQQINKLVPREIFARFIRTFMLETNSTSVRWQAHGLVQAIYK